MDYIWKINSNIKNLLGCPEYNKETLDEINKEKTNGLLHILYEKYSLKYGDNKYNSNIVVPYLENNIVKDLVIVNDVNDVENIVENHIKKMPNLKEVVLDSIISTTDNNHWRNQRSDFTGAFSIYDSLEPLIKISESRANVCTELLWLISYYGKKEVNMSEFFLNETMAQLLLAMFDVSIDFQNKFNSNIRKMFYNQDLNFANKYYRELLKELKYTHGPLGKILKERVPETQSELMGNILIFSFAGHDTTGHTLTWLMYELCKNQTYQQTLIDEVSEFWKIQKNKKITYKDFKRLPFISKCITETLRLWPPIPNGTFRELEHDDFVTGLNNKKIFLPKGTYVQIPIWNRHHNKELWGEDALIFNPYREFKEDENWNNDVIGSYNPSSERYSPFIYGPRDCIGKNFSQIEMRVILLYLFKNFRFELSENQSKLMNENTITFNDFTMGPRNIYNKSLDEKNLGMYVNVKPLKCAKL